MQLGELFFSLGFKNTASADIRSFDTAIGSAQATVQAMAKAVDKMVYLLEELAIKMGAVTRAELTYNKATDSENAGMKKVNIEEEKNLRAKKQKLGILSVLNAKMKAYWGELATARIQLLALSGVLLGFTEKAAKAAVHLDKLSSLSGFSTDSLQRLGDMAAQTGGSIDDIAGAISHLQDESINIRLGKGGNLGPYQFLGLDPHQDPILLLDRLGAKLRTMPTALGTHMARELGLSDDLIYFLKNTQNIKPIRDQTILSDKEIKRLKDFNFYFNRVFEQSKRVFQKFAAIVAPVGSQIIYFFDRLGLMFSGLMNKMDPFLSNIERWKPLLIALGTTLFAAFFPVTTAIVAMGLALEDISTYFAGGDSLFGRILDWFTRINGAAELFKDLLMWIGDLTASEGEKKWREEHGMGFAEQANRASSDMPDWFKKNFGWDINSLGKFFSSPNPTEGFGSGTVLKPGAEATTTINNSPVFNIVVNESRSPLETAQVIGREIAGSVYRQMPVTEAPTGRAQ